MSPLSITVYTTPVCRQCAATKRKLDELGVLYRVVDLSLPEHADAATYVREVLGFRQAPVVAVYRGEDSDLVDAWGGYDPDRLKALA